jgi:SAM-dependent methyltransferase
MSSPGHPPSVPVLSSLSRRLKKRYFLDRINPAESVLEIGCGDGWVARHLRERGVNNFLDIDSTPAAMIVGDIREWRHLGLRPGSFDVIIAFEVVEHVDCMNECFDLLKPDGRLMITTPYPPADAILEKLERYHFNQKRTSPHDHLTYLTETPQFRIERMWRPLMMSQWCIFKRKEGPSLEEVLASNEQELCCPEP